MLGLELPDAVLADVEINDEPTWAGVGTGTESRTGLLVWRSGLLSRALDRRWLRPVLDTDPDWHCMELRSMNDESGRQVP